MSGPLNGVRIVDLTTVLMGPFATQLLADMGADVIKIEAPGGDIARDVGPRRNPGMSGSFLHANRNKRSVLLDLKLPAARSALLRLVAGADVLVSNLRPQSMKRLGLAYEDVTAVKADLVYAGLYGFGEDGPYAGKPAYDDLIQGASALPAMLHAAGADAPRYVPSAMVDRIVGMSAAHAITAALFHRQRTGEGQAIEIPMFETMAQFVLGDHLAGHTFDPPVAPIGYKRLLSPNRKPYATRDGHICVLFYADRHWRAFFDLIGQPDFLQRNERFSTIGGRTEHIDELYAMVAEALTERSTAEWLAAFERADVPAMPMHTLASLVEDPHLAAVGFFERQEHPTEGSVRTMRSPTRWSRSKHGPNRPAPTLGQHTEEALREAGYDGAELDRLLRP
ncbi:MAG: CoA transferase [Comamonadaceae bacterium]|nr:MAG: CoA transferase [Comamonadaceae bacterium]